MNFIHTHPGEQRRLGLGESHVIIDREQFSKAQLMEMAMLKFIKRVEAGEIRSKAR